MSFVVGEIKLYAGSVAPASFAFCDGSAVDRTVNADLFSLIGTTFGAGDGSTTFNMPDLRGRCPVGVGFGDAVDASTWALAEKSGTEGVQLNPGQNAAHTHDLNVRQEVGNQAKPTPTRVLAKMLDATTSALIMGYSDSSPDTTIAGLGSQGSGASHNNVQPSLGLNFIIALSSS